MNQNERFNEARPSDSDAGESRTLPTRNPPLGDPGLNPRRGHDIQPGQPEVAGASDDTRFAGTNDTTNSSSNAGGEALVDDPVAQSPAGNIEP